MPRYETPAGGCLAKADELDAAARQFRAIAGFPGIGDRDKQWNTKQGTFKFGGTALWAEKAAWLSEKEEVEMREEVQEDDGMNDGTDDGTDDDTDDDTDDGMDLS
jgi:hypothetical protein